MLSDSLSGIDARDLRLAEIISNVGDAITRGEIVDLETICQANPDVAEELRRLWGTILVTDTAGAAQDEGLAEESGDLGSRWRSIKLPATIGDYELLEELGRGGMGVVYRAKQISLSREVAIKMILRGRLASEMDLQRFLAEASATAQLEHPGIVPVYEVGDFEGRPYFSMQLIEGRTLAEKAKGNPLPQRRSARIVATVARAIDFAHRHGVLHRDLKPSNILLTKAGTPLVTDFGLAKQDAFSGSNVDSGPDDLTKSGMLLGTPAYMSPEQAGGRRKEIGPTSDVYSLGCILYFALTGRGPFVAESTMDMVMQVIEQEPTPPRVLRPSMSRDLESIVIRCLQKPTDLRYPSASALADDLEAYLNDERVSARSGRFSQVVARVFRKTHHAEVLRNWGILWMWHSLVLVVASTLTWWMDYSGIESRWAYAGVWTAGLGAWAGVFWKLRQRMGPVTFIERQIAHVWGASMIAIGALFPVEFWLGLPPLTLSPLLGVISAMVFIIKAGMLTGSFYLQAAALLLASVAMSLLPEFSHLIFGVVSALCFFVPGYKYSRRRHVRS
ncbi:MAG: serine/threonine-protein kinase [Planctomycetota bacterium]